VLLFDVVSDATLDTSSVLQSLCACSTYSFEFLVRWAIHCSTRRSVENCELKKRPNILCHVRHLIKHVQRTLKICTRTIFLHFLKRANYRMFCQICYNLVSIWFKVFSIFFRLLSRVSLTYICNAYISKV
jgi:hypothetical protein